MSRRLLFTVLAAMAAGAADPGDTAAQGRVSVVLSTPTIGFAPPGVPDYDAGWIEHPGLDVAVSSRPTAGAWELRIRATSPTLGAGKPVSALEWRTDGSSAWSPMSEIGDMVLLGSGDRNITLHFRMLLSWTDDPPGTYGTGLELTILRI